MVYNPNNAKETPMLPVDTILDGVIIDIRDGKVKNFVGNLDKWKNPEQAAIEITTEVKNEDKTIQTRQVFTYVENNGVTEYPPKSNLGKFKEKYKKLPEAGDQVKIITNNDGFGKIKLD